MKLSIEINLGGAAFDDAAEVRRLLSLVSDKVDTNGGDRGFYSRDEGRLRDLNGNPCGTWTIGEDRP